MSMYNGHKICNRNGYEAIYLPTHPHSYKDGMVYVHVLVAEKLLGRYLLPDECVHHIDFNKKNNTVTNLMIFANNSSHVLYHNCLSANLPFKLICVNHVYKCELYNFSSKTCPICGGMKSSDAEMCIKCRHALIRSRRPSRNVLKQDIRSMSFVKIGKKYNVSDNAIRKWCVFYNLPCKSGDIKKISDENWKKI